VSISIPRPAKILPHLCFCDCNHLATLRFDDESELGRIEELCFHGCSLQSIVLPRAVDCVDRSAFVCASIASLRVDSFTATFSVYFIWGDRCRMTVRSLIWSYCWQSEHFGKKAANAKGNKSQGSEFR
jgi:hypothetical protein